MLHGKYKAARAAQNRQLLNFQARVMDLRAQETLFGGLEKWQRMQLQQPAVPVPPAGTAVSFLVHDLSQLSSRVHVHNARARVVD